LKDLGLRIKEIRTSDSTAMSVTADQVKNDALVLGKIYSSYQLAVARASSLDVASLKETELGEGKSEGKKGKFGRVGGGKGPERGRQMDRVPSPDGKWLALYKDRNVYLAGPKGENPQQVTTSGSEKNRIKCGSASWVYGEELEQKTAMWWSPDSKKVAYYRFDESKVNDFYLALDQTKVQDRLDVEAYPKPGKDNPVVELVIYDVETGIKTFVDVRDGKPFSNEVVGHYVYRVDWSPDGKELLFQRTDRLQKVLEMVAADPKTGKVRVILREEWPASWVENLPEIRQSFNLDEVVITASIPKPTKRYACKLWRESLVGGFVRECEWENAK
jgi:dipeptidyl-peptidase-4